MAGVKHRTHEVSLEDGKGGTVGWKPDKIGGHRSCREAFRAKGIGLCGGDRIR